MSLCYTDCVACSINTNTNSIKSSFITHDLFYLVSVLLKLVPLLQNGPGHPAGHCHLLVFQVNFLPLQISTSYHIANIVISIISLASYHQHLIISIISSASYHPHHIILINMVIVINFVIVAIIIITHRPLVKWFLRQTTRLCELQRVCYGETSGAPRTIAVGGWAIYTTAYNFIVALLQKHWYIGMTLMMMLVIVIVMVMIVIFSFWK